ncbi:MAG: major facilitator transporter [Glaciihabitans sp.]|jgi:MFS family permease|nr:major facilitator transporter [Glaciihabitans sp.]
MKFPTLPPFAAFAGATVSFGALYLASGAPTSLLLVYEREWGFPTWMLTVAFAAYSIGLLAALLVVGSLSDHVGRRPVVVGALVVELAAMLLFRFSSDIGWVIVARLVQGVATGAATGAFVAWMLELSTPRLKKVAAVMGSIASSLGLALGALLAGLAVQLSIHAPAIVFTILTIAIALGTLTAVFSSETVTPQAGAIRSLVPRVWVPPRGRLEFGVAVPGLIGAWMFAGLFLGLVPTIILDVFHIDSGLVNGITVFVEPAAAAVIGLALGRFSSARNSLIGVIAVLVGAGTIVTSVALVAFPLLVIGGIIGGLGVGAAFGGALRTLGPLAEAHQRAGLFAAIFVVSYLAFGVPAVIVGQLVPELGLVTTIIGYAGVILLVSVVALIAQARLRGRR